MRALKWVTFVATSLMMGSAATADASPWQEEWPNTDFNNHTVALTEIVSGGPPKDGIPSIDKPKFRAASTHGELGADEPVISLVINGDARAYPLRILIWHEIVNDIVGGVPVAVTYCPLCNAAIVFDRRADGRILDFGTTGKLRYSDLIMYDRQTESWWQQFSGESIVGALAGRQLTSVPSRIESWSRFRQRALDGQVLVPNHPNQRDYGRNPYAGYDSRDQPYGLFQGPLPEDFPPMGRVVVVDGEAWSLNLLREREVIRAGPLRLTWIAGQNSALDTPEISDGRDVGNVIVHRVDGDRIRDVAHDVTFAFVFRAFHPDGTIHKL